MARCAPYSSRTGWTPTRSLRQCFGGTTEIQKEIIARRLGQQA
jgi:alkylation response protein AidB-like acyl-CoA dehydrogenase